LARHQLSGFAIQYPDGFAWNRIGSIHEEDPKQRFFSHLHKKSMGDVDEAFLLWVSAIKSVCETTGLLVMMEREHGISSSLDAQSVSHLLLLRQLLQYGWLDIELVQQFFCCTQEIAEAWLSYLLKERFVFVENGYWFLRTEIRFSLISVLKKRGWL
jgi:hypothetical protein